MKKFFSIAGSIFSMIGFSAQAQEWENPFKFEPRSQGFSIDLSRLNQMERNSLFDKLMLNGVPVGVDIYEEQDDLVFDCVGCDIRELDHWALAYSSGNSTGGRPPATGK